MVLTSLRISVLLNIVTTISGTLWYLGEQCLSDVKSRLCGYIYHGVQVASDKRKQFEFWEIIYNSPSGQVPTCDSARQER